MINTHTNTATMTADVAQLRITRVLHEAEAALDEALIRQANLFAVMVSARRETGAAPFTGQEALLRLLKTQQATMDAGGELSRVHGRLNQIAVETGGGNDACPPSALTRDPAGTVEEIAAKAA